MPEGFEHAPSVAQRVGLLILAMATRTAARQVVRSTHQRLPLSLAQRVSNRFPHNFRGGFAADIGRSIFGARQDFLDAALDGGCGFGFTEVGQHHRGGPDLADGIGDAFSGDVWSGTVDGLEHGGILFRRIQIRGGSDPDRSHYRGAQIGKDVAEQVRSHDHVKRFGTAHKMGRENVDVILIGADIGELLRHGGKALVPIRHGMDDAI